jgi:hypothetical protein
MTDLTRRLHEGSLGHREEPLRWYVLKSFSKGQNQANIENRTYIPYYHHMIITIG